jgi:hypothetical protein
MSAPGSRVDHAQGAAAEIRRVDEGDAFAIRRPRGLDVVALASAQPPHLAAFRRQRADRAVIRQRDRCAIGRDTRMQAAERATREGIGIRGREGCVKGREREENPCRFHAGGIGTAGAGAFMAVQDGR